MKMRTGKVHPMKPVGGTQFGTTVEKSDPAKFHGPGKTHGKTPANDVVAQKEGPTFTANRTHIPSTNADKMPKETKLLSSGKDSLFEMTDTACDLTASQHGSGEPTDRPYGLKKSYEK